MSNAATLDFEKIGRRLMHPTQQAILYAMSEGGGQVLSPNLLSAQLGEALGNVSYHVKVLAGLDGTAKKPGKFTAHPLIELVKTEPRRGAVEHFYALAP